MRRRASVLACLLGLLAAVPALASPGRADLDRLDRRAATTESRLGDQRARLAATRARLEAARARYDAQLAQVRARLRAVYAEAQVDPVIAALAGDPADAAARAELNDAVARADAAMLGAYRASVLELQRTEAELRRRKERLAATGRVLAARRAALRTRLRASRPVRTADAPAGATVPLGTPGTGLLGASTAPAGALPTAPLPAGTARGLPAGILRARSLPGPAPRDARTGAPISLAPAPSGPAQSVALPGVGLTQPSVMVPRVPGATRRVMVAGWYSGRRTTASGEPYDAHAMAAASRTLPFGTLLRLGYAGRSVLVRVNDRGPYVAGRDLDLTPAAATALGMAAPGRVTAQILQGG